MEISERLLSAYPVEDFGVWEIYGEGIVLEGKYYSKLLDIISGTYKNVLEFAVNNPRFREGDIIKRKPIQSRNLDAEDDKIRSLESEKKDLLQRIEYLNKQIEYINKEIGLRIRSRIL